MKKIISVLTLIISFVMNDIAVYGQVPITEKAYEVSRKAKNGYLGGIDINKEKQTVDMVYILPSLIKRKVKYEIYTYNKDLELLNTVREEEWIDKVKSRWSWFNFKGDTYTVNSLTASVDMMGKLVFRKKLITGFYMWGMGSYYRHTKQLEKVKPKTDEGLKYEYKCAYEVEADSAIIVIAGIPEKKTINNLKHFEILNCDNNVNITTIGKLDFQYPNKPIYSAPLEDDNAALDYVDYPRDWIVVFAPLGAYKKDRDPKPTNLTYVRISSKGKVLEKFSFNSPSNGWRILGAYERNGSVFLYGSDITKDPTEKYIDDLYANPTLVPTTSASAEEQKEASSGGSGVMGAVSAFNAMGAKDLGVTQDVIDITMDELKYTNFQIGKISNGKFDFISNPNIDEFEAKQAKPLDQKKFVKFDGKKFVISGISFTSSGDIFIAGQDFKKKDGKRIFGGTYMFQFDPSGTLKKNYGVFIDQKKKAGFFNKSPLTSDMIPSYSYIQESGDGKSLYWLMKSAKNINKDSYSSSSMGVTTTTTTWTPLYGFDYGSINIANGELSEFKTFGDDEKRSFYLFNNTSSYKMANYLFFFSETQKGDKILLTRMDLSK